MAQHLVAFFAALAAVPALAAAQLDQHLLPALAEDDQCGAGNLQCALNALQLRGKKVAVDRGEADADAVDLSLSLAELAGNCATYGCSAYVRGRPCQCHSECWKQHSCCPDYRETCVLQKKPAAPVGPGLRPAPPATPPAAVAPAGACLSGAPTSYALNWEASGAGFFNDFTFMLEDETHGAAQYVGRGQAVAEGLVSAGAGGAIIRTGGRAQPYKRKSVNIHTNKAWLPSQGFLAAMKYKHVPWGAGVWPGFWAMNSDVLWPAGGELDIMEYANDEPNKVTFHTNKNCFLDVKKLNQCTSSFGNGGASNCNTNYFSNLFGCMPPQRRLTGQAYASQPGVLAVEWTAEHIKIFHIPEAEIPADLNSGAPKPEAWGKWVTSYFPFDAQSCKDIARPQELVISLALCGDWAGGAFQRSALGLQTGFTSASGKCHSDIWDPASDCCTKFVTSPGADSYLQSQAFFDISWVKVFTSKDKPNPGVSSATFRRGGVPLRG